MTLQYRTDTGALLMATGGDLADECCCEEGLGCTNCTDWNASTVITVSWTEPTDVFGNAGGNFVCVCTYLNGCSWHGHVGDPISGCNIGGTRFSVDVILQAGYAPSVYIFRMTYGTYSGYTGCWYKQTMHYSNDHDCVDSGTWTRFSNPDWNASGYTRADSTTMTNITLVAS